MLGHATTAYNFTITTDPASADPFRFRILYRLVGTAPLPFRFTSFRALQENTGVYLEWQTAEEEGVKAYDLERSFDGLNFSRQATVAANGGQEPSTYSHRDEVPAGVNFYRVRALYSNGDSRFSAIIKQERSSHNRFSIFPNPVRNNQIRLYLHAQPRGTFAMVVISVEGKKIWQQSRVHGGGSTAWRLNLGGNLPAGAYYLLITPQGGKSEYLPFQVTK